MAGLRPQQPPNLGQFRLPANKGCGLWRKRRGGGAEEQGSKGEIFTSAPVPSRSPFDRLPTVAGPIRQALRQAQETPQGSLRRTRPASLPHFNTLIQLDHLRRGPYAKFSLEQAGVFLILPQGGGYLARPRVKLKQLALGRFVQGVKLYPTLSIR